jgi:hypothetical protein
MAILIEAGVRVELSIRMDGAEDEQPQLRVIARAESTTATGERVRRAERDITDLLTAQQRTGAANLLAAVTDRVKEGWAIT